MYMAHHQSLEEKSSKPDNNTSNINNNNIMVSSSSSTFCYSDVSPSNPTTIHPHLSNTHLHSNFDTNSEIYHLTSGLEMIGFQSKPLDDPSDPSKDSDFFHDHDHHRNNHHLMAVVAPGGRLVEDHHHHHHHHHNQVGLFMDESSLRTCVFPCEGNERPSQGLSLSLSSSNPSSIGLQSFELRNNHPHNQRFNLSSSSNNSRDGLLGKSQSFQQDEFFLGKSLQFEIVRNSKYMCPVQELLNEFCTLGTQQKQSMIKKKKINKDNNWELLHDDQINDTNASSSSSSSSRNINTSLYGLSILELQKRKTKLFGMLEELDRRYKHYCDQLKVVESSYESVAGVNTANVYTTLASKAMSRHFRCLRDSLVAQIKATKKAMGQKNVTSTLQGTTMGETPRLRILDQTLRQQRAFQQMTSMESHPWRPQRGLPERSVSVLRAWLFEHFLHPYPSDVDKHILARQTCLTRSQVSNWFINARVRLWKPMVEQMYLEENKEQQKGSSSETTDHQPSDDHIGLLQDQKPDPDELVRLDPESLSSILNTTNNNPSTISTKILQNDNNALDSNNLQQSQPFGRTESFGYVALADFPSSSSSYNHNHTSPYVSTQNDNNTPHQGFGGGTSRGNNVSLTLGLQQHGGGNGVSLAFSPASQSSLFYGRDHIDDCQPVHHQYSLLNGDQGQNLPYRNLMDAQLLDDFAQ